MSGEMVYITFWHDRHSDPQFDVFTQFADAYEHLSDIKKTYGDRYQWLTSADEEDCPTWMQQGISNGTWAFYIQTSLDEGPHGYILARVLR